jgi:hypothetical protein
MGWLWLKKLQTFVISTIVERYILEKEVARTHGRPCGTASGFFVSFQRAPSYARSLLSELDLNLGTHDSIRASFWIDVSCQRVEVKHYICAGGEVDVKRDLAMGNNGMHVRVAATRGNGLR